ncbi:SDR family oxidoreductase [Hydrogenophaga sp. BPS33]|uniref:SDR family oxidoreductase n=1 Tax=Hydrogenophaga sp. BPS33 TaxID=2651974 RepID=UPI00131F58AA|nr:SDR family oxidoreductase [Hydrogenophaga sp. BPS33]QHE87532.1 SDR family oxidoreductase [Hydrogenophaga sp. BPS33]
MDLGITGRTALVMASSSGLGLACAKVLAEEGVNVWLNARESTRLEAAAAELRKTAKGNVYTVSADVTTDAGRQTILSKVKDVDILVTNNEGPKPGSLDEWDHGAWVGAFEKNMIPHALFIRHYVPGMRARQFGRIVNITSAMVKEPRAHQSLSAAARTALTAFSKALSREVAVDNVTINNVLPERIDTPRQRFMAERLMKQKGITMEEARKVFADSIAAKRFGKPEELASACAFLCSVQASFISGQNLQVDGGSFGGLM